MMKLEKLFAGFLPAWREFLAGYGWEIVALLLGALIVLVIWMVRHPEDFFEIVEPEAAEEDKEERA